MHTCYPLLLELTEVPLLLRDVPLLTFVPVGSALLNGSREAKGTPNLKTVHQVDLEIPGPTLIWPKDWPEDSVYICKVRTPTLRLFNP